MKSHVKAVVIGGGVVGCSVLYHLAKAGWTDIMLIERSELTSGSSWHAAGGFHTLNGDPNVAKLQEYTINIYKEIEQISGQSTGIHLTGGVMLVSNRDRWDWLKMAHARNRYLGVPTELIPVKEAKKYWPRLDSVAGSRGSNPVSAPSSILTSACVSTPSPPVWTTARPVSAGSTTTSMSWAAPTSP